MEEYGRYVVRERSNLQDLPRGAKVWWSKSRRLMQKKGIVSSVPALKDTTNQWVLQSKEKADLFVDTLSKKSFLNVEEVNEYTQIPYTSTRPQTELKNLTEKDASDIMNKLRIDSGTGPDLLPARILKHCSAALAKPVLLLTMCILMAGEWPQLWRQHWVAPLFKRKSVYHPGNYRGIHFTAQLSKVVERLLKLLYDPYLSAVSAFGPSQFAYTLGRGARDALALLVLTWVRAPGTGRKVAVYCSDVSGAFDRVRRERLIAKLKKKGLHPRLVAVLASWLQERFAHVVVGGTSSKDMILRNMVFQGTVTGPTLWNLFFEDARHAINECFYKEVVFADDLNAYRIYPSATQNSAMKQSLDNCQRELHKWGTANQVAFDAAKESQHVLSTSDPEGSAFKLLGVPFDTELSMANAVSELVSSAGWKLRTLLRTRRFYTDADLVVLYKAHLLSYLEYRTPALYHATRVVISRLDAVQNRFLRDVGVDDVTALVHFHLAPLSTRRDIAMLGLIHRTVRGKGPSQFTDFFRRDPQHSAKLIDPRASSRSPLIKRSALGLVAVYNLLPHNVVCAKSVSAFQRGLQELIKSFAVTGHPMWSEALSPRLPLTVHPLTTIS